MKKVLVLMISMLLVLTACAPKHEISVNVEMNKAFSGVLKINMSLNASDLLVDSSSDDKDEASINDVKTVIDKIISKGDNFNAENLKSSIDDKLLTYSYEEAFDSLSDYESLVSRISGEDYSVEVSTYGSVFSGEQRFYGLSIDAEDLVGWIYDDIELNKSFGENSTRARSYAKDESSLEIDGESISSWSSYSVENKIALQSVYLYVDLKDNSLIDSTLIFTADSKSMNEEEANIIVEQLTKQISDFKLREGEAYEFIVNADASKTEIIFKTISISGNRYSTIMDSLVDFSPEVNYTTTDDNKSATLDTSFYASYSDLNEVTNDITMFINLNDFELESVDGQKYNPKIHNDFELNDNVLSDLNNYSTYSLSKSEGTNWILIIGSVLLGLVVIALALLGFKKYSSKRDVNNEADIKTEHLVNHSNNSELPIEIDVVEEIKVEEETEVVEEVVVIEQNSIISTLEIDENSNTEKKMPFDFKQLPQKILMKLKNKETYFKAGIFFVSTVVFGFVCFFVSASSLDPLIGDSSSIPWLASAFMSLGSASASGFIIKADNGFMSINMIIVLPLLIAFAASYILTKVIASNLFDEKDMDENDAFVSNLSMSLVVCSALLILSLFKITIDSDSKIGIHTLGVLISSLPLHIITGFIVSYKTKFSVWPVHTNESLMSFIFKKLSHIAILAIIVTFYVLFKSGFEVAPLILNLFIFVNFILYGGSASLSNVLGGTQSFGAIITNEFKIVLFVVMIVSLVYLVYDIDSLFNKMKEENAMKFSAIFAGIMMVLVALPAWLSGVYLNSGFFGSITVSINFVSLVLSYSIIFASVYLRITILNGVDLRTSGVDAPKDAFVKKQSQNFEQGGVLDDSLIENFDDNDSLESTESHNEDKK